MLHVHPQTKQYIQDVFHQHVLLRIHAYVTLIPLECDEMHSEAHSYILEKYLCFWVINWNCQQENQVNLKRILE